MRVIIRLRLEDHESFQKLREYLLKMPLSAYVESIETDESIEKNVGVKL